MLKIVYDSNYPKIQSYVAIAPNGAGYGVFFRFRATPENEKTPFLKAALAAKSSAITSNLCCNLLYETYFEILLQKCFNQPDNFRIGS
jgi:hypothetical protein